MKRANFKGGWAGKFLNVDLTRNKIEKEPISLEFAEKYLGGIGFNSMRLFDLVGSDVDGLSPKNVIMFGVGPLAGTLYPGSTRCTITARSPQTDIYGSTNLGGHFGAELKYAGYDQLAVFGKAPKPVYIWIDDDEVEVRDASHLWGKDTWETGLKIKEELGDPDIQVLTIGQAGENLVRFACVINPPRGAGGRVGLGAVMGSKNLKAVAVRGTKGVKVARPDEFFRICRESTIFGRTEPRYEVLRRGGSTHWMDFLGSTGAIGVKNFRKNIYPEWNTLTGEKFQPGAGYTVRKRGCFSCPVSCSGFFNVREGEFQQSFGRAPEFAGTVISFLCDFNDIPAMLKMQELYDLYGIDIPSAAWMFAWAMDCYDRGILTQEDCDGLPLEWGNYKALIELIPKIAKREGFGNLLAEGEKRAPQKLGRGSEKFMYHVKGLSTPPEDPRTNKLFGFAYVTAPRGGDHLSSNTIWARDLIRGSELERQFFAKQGRWGAAPTAHDESVEGVAEAVMVVENLTAGAIQSAETCTRTGGSLEFIAQALSAATGVDFSVEKLLKTGERIFNVEKAFNSRDGMTRKDDTFSVPERFLKEPVEEGPYKGDVLDLEPMLDEYYQARGWDVETGLQTRAKLKELGLDHILKELEKVNAVR